MECPIVEATRTRKTPSSNPCNDCAYYPYPDCLANMTDNVGEKMLKDAGEGIEEIKNAIREHTKQMVKEAVKESNEPKNK